VIALTVLTIFYVTLIAGFIAGLQRRSGSNRNSPQPFVSVILAARNEAEHIERCLAALARQDYPPEKYEVIVVDDRSTDATASLAAKFERRFPNFVVLGVGNHRRYACPKKNALGLGIAQSRGELLLFTDADCIPPPTWISGMVSYFEPGVGLVAGHSPPEKKPDFFHGLLRLEALVSAFLAAGGIGLRWPLVCTGRNLSYRREVFEEVGGFASIGHLLAGDDVYLLRRVHEKTRWQIRFAASPETFVETHAPELRLGSLFHQKLRHTSKALHYSPTVVGVCALVYLYHLLLLGALIVAPLSVTALASFGLKSAVEVAAFIAAASLFNERPSLKYLPLFELLLLPYVVVFGALGSFRSFTWKGVKVRPSVVQTEGCGHVA